MEITSIVVCALGIILAITLILSKRSFGIELPFGMKISLHDVSKKVSDGKIEGITYLSTSPPTTTHLLKNIPKIEKDYNCVIKQLNSELSCYEAEKTYADTLMLREIISEFRYRYNKYVQGICIKNHIHKKSIQEFDAYIDHKFVEFLELIHIVFTDYLDKYPNFTNYKFNSITDIMDEGDLVYLKSLMKKMFTQLQRVIIEYRSSPEYIKLKKLMDGKTKEIKNRCNDVLLMGIKSNLETLAQNKHPQTFLENCIPWDDVIARTIGIGYAVAENQIIYVLERQFQIVSKVIDLVILKFEYKFKKILLESLKTSDKEK